MQHNTYMIDDAIPILPYFENNIFYNLNDGADDKAFVYHRIPDYETCRLMIDAWKERGEPDIIIGHPNLEIMHDDRYSYDNYALVKIVRFGFIYKNKTAVMSLPVYVKYDLLGRYQLTELDDDIYNAFEGGSFHITDDMRKAYEEGKDVDNILKPYLDAMFGEV